MLGLILVAMLSHHDGGTDVPTLDFPPMVLGESKLLDVREVKAGDPAPGDGAWMPEAVAIELAKGKRGCEVERTELRKDPPAPPFAALLGAALIGGAAAVWIYTKLPRGSP